MGLAAGMWGACAAAGVASAADPDRWQPTRAALEVLRTPARALGDTAGAAGLVSAALLASVGDGVALADRNPVTRGLASGGIHRIAQGLSFAGTQSVEFLRGEEVERWPEAPATYLEAAPFTGRLDTALSGVSALRMAFVDLALGWSGAIARGLGANSLADRLVDRRRRAATVDLGPPPLRALPPRLDGSGSRAADAPRAGAPSSGNARSDPGQP